MLLAARTRRGAGAPPGPGSLLQDAPLRLVGDSAELDDKSDVHRVRYDSTSGISGEVVEVSGMELVPKGKPQQPRGYPLISYGHGAVGFDQACGPTEAKSLGPDDTGRVAALLDAGYVVVVSDYQGLGPTSGSRGNQAHPFREPKTTGYNMIDAARAAKTLMGRLGKALSGKWAAYGESQGGAAAWAIGDLAAGYGSRPDGDGLDLVGVAAEKPPTDFAWLVDGAANGTLGEADQISYLRLLKGLQVAHPEMALDQYVRGPLADKGNQDAVFACFAQAGDRVAAIAAQLRPDDTRLAPPCADRLRGWLASWTLPLAGSEGPSTPFFVAAGMQDDVAPVAAVRAGVLREREQRATEVQVSIRPGGTHREFDDSQEAIRWLGDRFADRFDPGRAGTGPAPQ